jgi:cell wall-associated NlpC family hydrolase
VRALGLAIATALTLVAGSAAADDTTPTKREIHQAEAAAQAKERDVAAVQADLVLANQRLQASAVEAAQAAEAWNGARYRLEQAQKEAAAAEERSAAAVADVERQRQAYGDTVASSVQQAPELTALNAIAGSDGLDSVIEQVSTMRNAETALDANYDSFRAASTLADVATERAQQARSDAAALELEASEAKDRAQAAADSAAAAADSIAAEKTDLIAELARLQDISVDLAERRQTALEQAAAEAAAAAALREQRAEERRERRAAQAAARAAAKKAAQQAAQQAAQEQASQPKGQHHSNPQPHPQPQPQPQPQPSPPPAPAAPPAPPAPSSGAPAAISFARAQLGEPYQWGAAGPGAWDCSGLTMGAWQAGGKYLPHYSVAQYEQSTPISAGSLRPGDLVFWGSSSSPSSIYHVALYVGGGQIIHAPRTGRPVTQESMYYWIPPNFMARP